MGNRKSAGRLATLFTIIIALVCLHRRKGVDRKQEMIFVLAGLISFNGSRMELNPAADLLAVLAAFVWACYSILTRKISSFGIKRQGLLQSLSLPMLSEKTGGEILQRTGGLKDGFKE